MRSNKLLNNRPRQSGFTLVEILISVFVIAVGLLGLGGLQIVSTKGSNNAHFRTSASLLVMNISDRMRANQDAVNLGLYETNISGQNISCSTTTRLCRSSVCTPQELARFDIQEVKCGIKRGERREGGVKNMLPNGELSITCTKNCSVPPIDVNFKRELSVEIKWNQQNVDKAQISDDSKRSLKVPVIP